MAGAVRVSDDPVELLLALLGVQVLPGSQFCSDEMS